MYTDGSIGPKITVHNTGMTIGRPGTVILITARMTITPGTERCHQQIKRMTKSNGHTLPKLLTLLRLRLIWALKSVLTARTLSAVTVRKYRALFCCFLPIIALFINITIENLTPILSLHNLHLYTDGHRFGLCLCGISSLRFNFLWGGGNRKNLNI